MASETFTFYVQPWYRKSPYFEATKRHGCKSWGLYNHMLLPTLYDDPVTEYWALLRDVTLWDVSVERCVEVNGPGRVRVHEPVHLPRPHDVSRRCSASTCCSRRRRGGIVNDPVLLRSKRNRFWLALADSDALLYADRRRGRAGMDVDIYEADVSPMQIQGPSSQGRDARPVRRRGRRPPVLLLRRGRGGRHPLVVSPDGMDRRGRLRALPARRSLAATSCSSACSRPASPTGCASIAPSEARRIEAGIFNYGSDMRFEDTPFHVRGWSVRSSWTRRRTSSASTRCSEIRDGDLLDRKLVGIDIGGEPMTDEGALNDFWPLVKGDARLGRVTAGAWSPRLERNIGYAWVPIRWEAPGSEFEAETPRGRVPVTVASLPFVDPSKDIPKS